MYASDFRKWVRDYSAGKLGDHETHANEKTIRTHGSMGVEAMYSIPPDKEKEACERFVASVYVNKSRVCLAEALSSPLFNFFIDLDIKAVDRTDVAEVEMFVADLGKIIMVTICEFFPYLKSGEFMPFDESGLSVEATDYAENPLLNANNPDLLDGDTLEWNGAGTGSARLIGLFLHSGLKRGEHGCDIGIHAYFPGRLLVNTLQALLIRKRLVQKFVEVLGNRTEEGQNDWEAIVDKNVYVGRGGLRCPASCKFVSCAECFGKGMRLAADVEKYAERHAKASPDERVMLGLEREIPPSKEEVAYASIRRHDNRNKPDACSACQGAKHVMKPSSYRISCILEADGSKSARLGFLYVDPFQLMMAARIRSNVDDSYATNFVATKEVRLYEGDVPATALTSDYMPEWARDAWEGRIPQPKGAATSASSSSSGWSGGNRKKRPADGTPAAGRPPSIGVLLTEEESKTAQQVIMSIIKRSCPRYEKLRPVSLVPKPAHHGYILQVQGEGENYCHAAKRDHGRIVSFFVSQTGVRQNCFSESCKADNPFSERPRWVVPPEIIVLLFGSVSHSLAKTKALIRTPGAEIPSSSEFHNQDLYGERTRKNLSMFYELSCFLNSHRNSTDPVGARKIALGQLRGSIYEMVPPANLGTSREFLKKKKESFSTLASKESDSREPQFDRSDDEASDDEVSEDEERHSNRKRSGKNKKRRDRSGNATRF